MAVYRVKLIVAYRHWLLPGVPPTSSSSVTYSPFFLGKFSCFASRHASTICQPSLRTQSCTFGCHTGFSASGLFHSALKSSKNERNIRSSSNTRDREVSKEVPHLPYHVPHHQCDKYPSPHSHLHPTRTTRYSHPIQYTNPTPSIPSPHLLQNNSTQPIPTIVTIPNHQENVHPLPYPNFLQHPLLPLPLRSSSSTPCPCYQAISRPAAHSICHTSASRSHALTAPVTAGKTERRGKLHQHSLQHSAAATLVAAPLSDIHTSPSTTSFIIPFSTSGLSSFSPFSLRNHSTSSSTTRNFTTTTMTTLVQEKEKFTPPADLSAKYSQAEVHRYVTDCMTAVGTPKPHAQALADVLLAADTRGHYSHGLNRLEMYVNDVRQGVCAGGAVPTITKESVSTALVNGHNGLGPVVGNFCVDLAVKKAKETGIGWVCARGSNHYGIAGWYAMRATKKGMLGMSFTNTSPLVAPTRAKKAALGTNPIAVSAPAKNGDDFVLDMATCVVAIGKIEVERRKEKPIPQGWAINKDGQPTTDAAEGISGALLPLGGPELHSGYKGYGLSMLVEVLCGIMSGGQYGPNVRRWMQTDREADLGQCFVAIDPTFFAPGFEDRMSDLMGYCRDMEPADEGKPVLAAGDPERAHTDKVMKEGGITYHINQIKDSWKLAKALGVKPME